MGEGRERGPEVFLWSLIIRYTDTMMTEPYILPLQPALPTSEAALAQYGLLWQRESCNHFPSPKPAHIVGLLLQELGFMLA